MGVLSPWLKGTIFFAAWAVGLILVMRIAYAHLRQLSRQTRTDLDDIILRALSVPLVIVILVSGGLILTKFLPLSPTWDKGLNLGVKIAFILAGVFFLDRLAKALLRHYSTRADYLRASFGVVQIAVRAVVLLLTLLIILDMAGVSITPLLASLGVGSLALALALQAPLVNFFAGLQLVADKPIQVGQYVKLNTGEEGTVTRIGWRATVITTLGNNYIVVPNSKMADAIITNYDLPDRQTSVVFQVGVHYKNDLDKVERIAREVALEVLETVAGGVKHSEPLVRYHTLGETGINFNVILRADAMTSTYLLKHEFIKRLHRRYRQEGVVFPMPIGTIQASQEDLLLLKDASMSPGTSQAGEQRGGGA
jgi:small-conductance mechanosensitive channel